MKVERGTRKQTVCGELAGSKAGRVDYLSAPIWTCICREELVNEAGEVFSKGVDGNSGHAQSLDSGFHRFSVQFSCSSRNAKFRREKGREFLWQKPVVGRRKDQRQIHAPLQVQSAKISATRFSYLPGAG